MVSLIVCRATMFIAFTKRRRRRKKKKIALLKKKTKKKRKTVKICLDKVRSSVPGAEG